MSTIAELGAGLQRQRGGKPGTRPPRPASWLPGLRPESRKRHGQLEMGTRPGELGLPASQQGRGWAHTSDHPPLSGWGNRGPEGRNNPTKVTHGDREETRSQVSCLLNECVSSASVGFSKPGVPQPTEALTPRILGSPPSHEMQIHQALWQSHVSALPKQF